jgi:TPP-dependent pyruvate/acetoin dehydrogenase alpha subunit
MRSPTCNVPVNIAEKFPSDVSLTMFERMCLVRDFEQGAVAAIEKGRLTYQVYLSTGQESVAAALSLVVKDYLVFAQHRAHDIFLAFGAPPEKLRDELLGLSTGSSQGRAGSNCLQHFGDGISMFGHHGLIGENVPQGVGAALGSGKRTLCVFGDGAAEEDYVLAAMGFAVTHNLPVLFVCIDNDLSILTRTEERRTWSITDVAKSFGMPAMDIADDPWAVLDHTQNLLPDLPALINCHVCREFWHVGKGNDGPPEWDRFTMVRDELIKLGLEDQVREVEEGVSASMERLWA